MQFMKSAVATTVAAVASFAFAQQSSEHPRRAVPAPSVKLTYGYNPPHDESNLSSVVIRPDNEYVVLPKHELGVTLQVVDACRLEVVNSLCFQQGMLKMPDGRLLPIAGDAANGPRLSVCLPAVTTVKVCQASHSVRP